MVERSIDWKAEAIERVCHVVTDDPAAAVSILAEAYPFAAAPNAGRRYTERELMTVFMRDGFIDRYFGQRLVFPGTLRLLSNLLPGAFPFHPNWKTDECHQAYWELLPTLDHVVPVTRGGADASENWVTSSMAHNAAKSNYTLDDLGWRLVAAGDLKDWDGLTSWFLHYAATYPDIFDRHISTTVACCGARDLRPLVMTSERLAVSRTFRHGCVGLA